MIALVLAAIAPLCDPSALACRPAPVLVTQTGGTGAADPLGRGHWLIDEENDEVLLLKPGGAIERFAVGRWPEQLVATRDGRIIVSCRESGHLAVIAADGTVQQLPMGPEPRALALDEDAHRLYVGLVTGRRIVALDARTLEAVAWHDLPFEPTTLATTGAAVAVGSRKSAEVVLLDPETLAEKWTVAIPAQPGAIPRVEALISRGEDVFVATKLADTGAGQTPSVSEGGGYGGARATNPMFVSLFVLRRAGLAYVPAELFRHLGLSDVSVAARSGSRLYLGSRGVPRFLRLDLDDREADLRVSLGVPGVGAVPLALSIAPGRELALLDTHRRRILVGDRDATVLAFDLPRSRLDPELRRGRELFFTAGDLRISSRAIGCASCHPDGREDGLVWRLEGASRQTPMLAAGRLQGTAPFNWVGGAPTLEANVTQTIGRRLGGSGLQRDELHALTRFLRQGLRPVHLPTVDPALAAAGRAVFADARVGCAACHPADFELTDGARHDVESLGPAEWQNLVHAAGRPPERVARIEPKRVRHVPNPELPDRKARFDTPSLIGLSSTAPYFHDGSAATLEDVIDHNRDRMGTTSQLTARERTALLAYLRSL